MNCEFCQSAVHIWFDCPKKPNGWKPSRLAKKSIGGGEVQTQPSLPVKLGDYGAKSTAARKADVQRLGTAERSQVTGPVVVSSRISALPVEPNREPSPSSDCKSDASPKEGLAAASSNLGAPTKFDKKAWMRQYMVGYMRTYRAKKKEAGG